MEMMTNESLTSGSRKRILLVTESFPPVSHSGTLRTAAFARYLPRFGVDVDVLTAAQEYRTNRGVSEAQSEEVLGCNVFRCNWKYEQGNRFFPRILRRVPGLNGWYAQQYRKTLASAIVTQFLRQPKRPGYSAIIASSPPSEALLVGERLAAELDLPFIVDLRDLWTYVSHYRHYFDWLHDFRIESSVLKSAKAILVTTNGARDVVCNSFGIPSSRCHLVPNGFDVAELEQPANQEISDAAMDPTFVITYTGELSSSKQSKAQSERCLDLIIAEAESTIHGVRRDTCLTPLRFCFNADQSLVQLFESAL